MKRNCKRESNVTVRNWLSLTIKSNWYNKRLRLLLDDDLFIRIFCRLYEVVYVYLFFWLLVVSFPILDEFGISPLGVIEKAVLKRTQNQVGYLFPWYQEWPITHFLLAYCKGFCLASSSQKWISVLHKLVFIIWKIFRNINFNEDSTQEQESRIQFCW